MSDFEQLVRASRLYYELGETQNAIAEQLGVTRPQVSRLLKRARAEGIVEIRIIDRTAVESPAADALLRRYDLHAVHLAPTIAGPEELTRRMVGRLAAEVLRGALRTGAIVGIGDGVSVAATAAALEETATPVAVTVVPLCGGHWSTGTEREPYRRIADALGGQARGLMSPGLVDDAATQRALVAHAGVRAIIDLWDRLDVVLFGIGGPAWTAARVGDDVERDLEEADAVGEVLVAPFDLGGRFVCPALRERVIALDARRLGRVPVAIGVASGEAKVRPILGRPAGRRGPLARHGCGHGGSGRRSRRGDSRVARCGAAMRAREPAVLGLDLGTTEVKAGLVSLDGRLLALARSGYALDVSGGHGWAEQDPGAWWSAVVSAVRALRAADVAEIVAIGTDGHGPTLVAVDARGEATRPAITFLDARAAAEADELTLATGVHGWSLGGLPSALWVERHEPAVAAATRWYMSTWEWLALRLTGVAEMPLVPDQVVADLAVVAAAGVPDDRLPPRSSMGDVVGGLTGTAADALGLRPGIPVVGGTVDAFASYLGAGLLEPGMPSTRAARRAGSASTGTGRSRSPAAS